MVHPFNLQNQGTETYAQWQYRKGGDTIRFFLEARTAEEMFRDFPHSLSRPPAARAGDPAGFSVVDLSVRVGAGEAGQNSAVFGFFHEVQIQVPIFQPEFAAVDVGGISMPATAMRTTSPASTSAGRNWTAAGPPYPWSSPSARKAGSVRQDPYTVIVCHKGDLCPHHIRVVQGGKIRPGDADHGTIPELRLVPRIPGAVRPPGKLGGGRGGDRTVVL